MAFMPENAPLVVLSFLGTCFLLGLAAVVFFYGWIARKPRRAGQALGAAVIIGGLYITLLVGAALASRERTLGPAEWKYFCEVDCHIAYSVTNVRQAKTIGEGGAAKTALGTFYLVTIRTRFDEATIGPQRGKGVLYANPREVYALDEQGHIYTPLTPDLAELLRKPLRPGESYDTQALFDLPSDVREPRLFIKNAGWENYLLIGHENSPLHKKAYFALRS